MTFHSHTLFAAITGAAFCLCGPAVTETLGHAMEECHAQAGTSAAPRCKTIKTEFEAKIRDCVATRQTLSHRSHGAGRFTSSHAYRASFLICSQEVGDMQAAAGG